MLIAFTVENFRSFASEQTLSLNAGRFRSERVGVVADSGVKGVPNVLRSMAIMGGNGSGKSSLFGAISLLQFLVDTSAQGMQKGDEFPVKSHRLNDLFVNKSSKFEIEFIHFDTLYNYAIEINKKYVIQECLHSRKKGGALREVFSRSRDGDGKYKWNISALPAENAKLWRDSTRENSLFLSVAVQLNSEELSRPFEWISDNLRVYHGKMSIGNGLTSHMIKDHVDDGCRDEILNLIRESDLGIRDISIRETPFDLTEISSDIPDEVREKIVNDLKGETFYESEFQHRTVEGKNVSFDFEDESDGTQKIFELAGHIVYSLKHNVTLLIDEIDTSLHPLLVKRLVQMFQYPKNEESRAQLIFSTHDTGLLDSGVLEHDQFVFIEKRRGASEIIPLIEYKPRRGESVRKNYLLGRYGGVPAISRVK